MFMDIAELRALVETLLYDIEFVYNGKPGSICPLAEDFFALACGDMFINVTTVDEVFSAPFLDGKTIPDVLDQITFY